MVVKLKGAWIILTHLMVFVMFSNGRFCKHNQEFKMILNHGHVGGVGVSLLLFGIGAVRVVC
jgi:hypothetical protein